MATQLRAELGDDVTPDEACEWGYLRIVEGLKDDLGRIGVHFDTWFSERTLHERGDVADVLAQLEARGVVYEQDGARWLRSTDFGDPRDRVLVRSDGTTTYLCNDLAYHRDKFRARLHAPHRHLGRRPPRSGEVAAGRHGGARLRRRASPRSCSAST